MWKCPNCEELIEDNFDTCWNCGTYTDGTLDTSFVPDPDAQDAPDQSKDPTAQHLGDSPARNGFADSLFANFALLIGQGCALIVCVFAIIYGVLCMIANNWIGVALLAPLSFFLSLANLVVMSRVRRL